MMMMMVMMKEGTKLAAPPQSCPAPPQTSKVNAAFAVVRTLDDEGLSSLANMYMINRNHQFQEEIVYLKIT